MQQEHITRQYGCWVEIEDVLNAEICFDVILHTILYEEELISSIEVKTDTDDARELIERGICIVF